MNFDLIDHKRRVRLPFLFLLITVLLSFFTWSVTGAGLAEVGIFIAIFLLLVIGTKLNNYAKILFLFFFSVLVSSFLGACIGYDFQIRIIVTFLISTIFIALACSYKFDKKEIDWLFNIYILASAIGSIFILINVIQNHQYGYMRYSVTFWGVDRDSLYVCAYQAGALYLSINRMIRAKNKRLLYAIISLIIIVGGLFTGNRSFVLLLGFIIAYSFVYSFLTSKKKIFLVVGLLIIISLGIFLFFSIQKILPDYIVQRIFNLDSLTDNDTRTLMWKDSFSLFLKSPIFGIGLENNNLFLRASGLRYSHNMFLDILCSQGIVGICIFLALIIYPTIKSNNKLYSLGFAIASLMTLFFVNGYNTMTFWIPVLLIFLQSKYCVE